MSKAAKQSILILILLLFAAFGFAFLNYYQKQQSDKARVVLDKQIEEYRLRENKNLLDIKKMESRVKEIDSVKAELQAKLDKFKDVDVDGLKEKSKKLTEERDKLKERLSSLQTERDNLLVKLTQQPKEKIVYKYVEKEPEEKEGDEEKKAELPFGAENESFWAQVLREKAALELDLEKAKSSLTTSSVEIVELKKKNSDLQLELSSLAGEKESLEREIKYGKDLSDTLSLELARTKNDKKFLNDRLIKLNTNNSGLQGQIKRLTSTKIALEKSIVRIQEEKKAIEKKLIETENVIQGRIDEIWEIKDNLEKSFKPAQTSSTGEVELPPIVVSSQGPIEQPDPSFLSKDGVGFDGNIVSVNQENNFVIVDIGQNSGVRIGDRLNVYRGADYIAGVEVIQVRSDIAAADIKEKVAKIQVGDAIK